MVLQYYCCAPDIGVFLIILLTYLSGIDIAMSMSRCLLYDDDVVLSALQLSGTTLICSRVKCLCMVEPDF